MHVEVAMGAPDIVAGASREFRRERRSVRKRCVPDKRQRSVRASDCRANERVVLDEQRAGRGTGVRDRSLSDPVDALHSVPTVGKKLTRNSRRPE